VIALVAGAWCWILFGIWQPRVPSQTAFDLQTDTLQQLVHRDYGVTTSRLDDGGPHAASPDEYRDLLGSLVRAWQAGDGPLRRLMAGLGHHCTWSLVAVRSTGGASGSRGFGGSDGPIVTVGPDKTTAMDDDKKDSGRSEAVCSRSGSSSIIADSQSTWSTRAPTQRPTMASLNPVVGRILCPGTAARLQMWPSACVHLFQTAERAVHLFRNLRRLGLPLHQLSIGPLSWSSPVATIVPRSASSRAGHDGFLMVPSPSSGPVPGHGQPPPGPDDSLMASALSANDTTADGWAALAALANRLGRPGTGMDIEELILSGSFSADVRVVADNGRGEQGRLARISVPLDCSLATMVQFLQSVHEGTAALPGTAILPPTAWPTPSRAVERWSVY